MVTPRTRVADGNRLAARQLALEIDRVLLHSRRGAVLIDVADVRANTRKRAERITEWLDKAIRERIGQAGGWRRPWRGLSENRVLRVPDLTIVVRAGAWSRIIVRCPIQAVAAADD